MTVVDAGLELPLPRTRRPRSARAAVGSLGPAFVAAVAYVDPGNVATNVTAGARYGYLLCWVVVAASATAMLVQYLSAKLGIATGASLPVLCRRRWSRRTSTALWVQAECVSIATELAEVIGGAVALWLLFGMPLLAGAVTTTVASMAVLALQKRSRQHRFEIVVTAMLAVCAVGFVFTAWRAGPSPSALAAGVLPRLQGADSPVACRRNPRRDGHAARDLPALRARVRPVQPHRPGVRAG
nr:Nramp family divalent metal transporter [Motilibacter peucedani]